MHVLVIIREPRSGCERARLKLFSIQSIVSSFVGVTDSRHTLVFEKIGEMNSRQLCKPSTSSRVCIAVSNSPNPSRVYNRLCKHRKRFLLLKYSRRMVKQLTSRDPFLLINSAKSTIVPGHRFSRYTVQHSFMFLNFALEKIPTRSFLCR